MPVSQQKGELMLCRINCPRIRGTADLNSAILPVSTALAQWDSSPHGLLWAVGIQSRENQSYVKIEFLSCWISEAQLDTT